MNSTTRHFRSGLPFSLTYFVNTAKLQTTDKNPAENDNAYGGNLFHDCFTVVCNSGESYHSVDLLITLLIVLVLPVGSSLLINVGPSTIA